MNVTVRPASTDDLDRLAWAMLRGSREGRKVGIFDLIFQTEDETVLLGHLKALAQTTAKSFCHRSNFLIAADAGRSIGVLCGYEPRIASMAQFEKALEEIGFTGSMERIATCLLVRPEIDRQTWMLEFAAVLDEAATPTVLEALIKKSLLSARLKGYRKAQVLLPIGLDEMQDLFERQGFAVLDEKRSKLYAEQFGPEGLRRLQLML